MQVCLTVGTTNVSAIDDVVTLSSACRAFNEQLWVHVDAAYAGCGAICPEIRDRTGIACNTYDSIVIDAHKWLLVTLDCSTLWVRDSSALNRSMNVDSSYLPEVDDARDFCVSVCPRQ